MDKFHPFKPGSIVQLRSSSFHGDVPLFRVPRGHPEAFISFQSGMMAMYADSDGAPQNLMLQLIVGDVVGWTYWAYVVV